MSESKNAALRRYMPPPRLSVADWSDVHRVLGRGETPMPGPWRTARTPYLREPMDAAADPAVETVVLHFSSQIGKTEVLLNTMLYSYAVDPTPGMFVMPTLELADAVSTDRLIPALSNCDVLRDRVGEAVKSRKADSRKTDDAKRHKRINGVPLTLSGANSAASLSSRPVGRIWADEIDRWPAATPEGDPLSLVFQRSSAYRRRKVILASTPTIKGASRIEDWFARSDQRYLWSPCPRCLQSFVVSFSDVRWTSGSPETAHLECPHCAYEIGDAEKVRMLAASDWRPSAPFYGIRGFRTWAIATPWLRLDEMVRNFLAAKQSVATLQAWVNLTRGESWEPPSERVEASSLLIRREKYPEEVPAGVAFLTAGVDTQDDRLEALIMGWGAGEESWVVARIMVPGDPARSETWAELDREVLVRRWNREGGGALMVEAALVDCLGHRTNDVYRAVIARRLRRVYASVGKSGGESGMLVSMPKAVNTSFGAVPRVVVDADQVKNVIYARLRVTDPGAEYVHLPSTVGETFVDELTAERLETRRNKFGVPEKRWVVFRERNETLDCFGMALAAMRIIAPTPAKFAELAAKVRAAADAVQSAEARPPVPRVRRSAYLGG